jgi:hypothetical protein
MTLYTMKRKRSSQRLGFASTEIRSFDQEVHAFFWSWAVKIGVTMSKGFEVQRMEVEAELVKISWGLNG